MSFTIHLNTIVNPKRFSDNFTKQDISNLYILVIITNPILIILFLSAYGAGYFGHIFSFVAHLLAVTILIQIEKKRIAVKRAKEKVEREKAYKLSRTADLLSITGNLFFIENYNLLKSQANDIDIFDIINKTNENKIDYGITIKRISAGKSIFSEKLNVIALNQILSQGNSTEDVNDIIKELLKKESENYVVIDCK